MGLTGVLIDITSIQQYLFGSNRLKENLGGSYLVKSIYGKPLQAALDETAPGHGDVGMWSDAETFSGGVKIGYIGGGNALLLFQESEVAKKFCRAFSLQILVSAPGLRTVFAIAPFHEENFPGSMRELHQELARAKSREFPAVTVGRHGITAECPYTGEAVEARCSDPKSGRLISRSANVRLKTAPTSGGAFKKLVAEEAGDNYDVTDDLGSLGQPDERSYIAIVHIDGNRIGEKFRNCATLSETRILSLTLEQELEQAFRGVVRELAGKIGAKDLCKDNGFRFSPNGERTILPLRPIIIGGDDITFVCEGKLGLYLAERFIAGLKSFDACAGVAVVKSKYPFFRGYQLAEELCASAKAKAAGEGGSWLDFLISAGGAAGSLEEIRQSRYAGSEGPLVYAPYRLDTAGRDESISLLKDGISCFHKWPKNKMMALREELTGPKEGVKKFLDAAGLTLPGAKKFGDNGWDSGRTPFFDMIDLFDFYPKVLLKEVTQ